jgi:hypothetical protein
MLDNYSYLNESDDIEAELRQYLLAKLRDFIAVSRAAPAGDPLWLALRARAAELAR